LLFHLVFYAYSAQHHAVHTIPYYPLKSLLSNYVSRYIFGDTRLEIVESNFLAEKIQLLQEFLLSIFSTTSVNQIQNYSALLHGEHLPILDVRTQHFLLRDFNSTFFELLQETRRELSDDSIFVFDLGILADYFLVLVIEFRVQLFLQPCLVLLDFSSLRDVIGVIDTSLEITIFSA